MYFYRERDSKQLAWRACLLELSSGPKKFYPNLPEPVHLLSGPGPADLAWYINYNYEPEPNSNPPIFLYAGRFKQRSQLQF